jgi:hypothetical protein
LPRRSSERTAPAGCCPRLSASDPSRRSRGVPSPPPATNIRAGGVEANGG